MKLPEPPPRTELFPRKPSPETRRFLVSPEGRDLLAKINSEYLYWDRVKHRKVPKGVSVEEIWKLVRSARLYRSNHLSLEKPEGDIFHYWVPDTAMRILHYLDRKSAGTIGLDTPGLPSGTSERYLISSLMEEAIASSRIEGADTTRLVAKEMLRTGKRPSNRAEQMILNNYVTIKKIKDLSGEPLTVDLLNSLQASMTENTLDDPHSAGRLRRPDERIQVVDSSDGTVLHAPPPAGQLKQRLEKLCRFANLDEGPFIHPVVKAVLLHFWLAYEHPYVDGNGRTARALFYWYALKKGYWLFEYVSISRTILRAHRQYLRSFLYSELDGCDATYFLMNQLGVIRTAIDDLHSYLARKQEEYHAALGEMRMWPHLNFRQQAVLHHALKHPDAVYTVQSHRNSHNVAYATARWDLRSLSTQGLLKQGKTGKKLVFTVPADLKKRLRI